MLFMPQQTHHYHEGKTVRDTLPDTFGLLCWNIHKANKYGGTFDRKIRLWQNRFGLEITLFQETRLEIPCVTTWTRHCAANLRIGNRYFGVCSAASAKPLHVHTWLSQHREFGFATPKSMLATRYRLANGTMLSVLNVHALNFHKTDALDAQLQRIRRYLETTQDAIVVAGDFNTWNKARYKRMLDVARALKLKRVPFRKTQGVKHVGGLMLDHIFYRGLHLRYFDVPDDDGISDHRPLIACFQ